jgi:hypothetical protein
MGGIGYLANRQAWIAITLLGGMYPRGRLLTYLLLWPIVGRPIYALSNGAH